MRRRGNDRIVVPDYGSSRSLWSFLVCAVEYSIWAQGNHANVRQTKTCMLCKIHKIFSNCRTMHHAYHALTIGTPLLSHSPTMNILQHSPTSPKWGSEINDFVGVKYCCSVSLVTAKYVFHRMYAYKKDTHVCWRDPCPWSTREVINWAIRVEDERLLSRWTKSGYTGMEIERFLFYFFRRVCMTKPTYDRYIILRHIADMIINFTSVQISLCKIKNIVTQSSTWVLRIATMSSFRYSPLASNRRSMPWHVPHTSTHKRSEGWKA